MFSPVYDPYEVMRECDAWSAEQKQAVWNQMLRDLHKYDRPQVWVHDVACRLFGEEGTNLSDPRIKKACQIIRERNAQWVRENNTTDLGPAELVGFCVFWKLHSIVRFCSAL
jgi:hypothetical protein